MSATTKSWAPLTVGVVGSGQLGRMMAFEGHKMGLQIIPMGPGGALDPATQVCRKYVEESLSHHDIDQLDQKCNIITVETEHVNVSALKKSIKNVFPSPKALEIIQDKYLQKEYFCHGGVPVAPQREISSVQDIQQFVADMGLPFYLKYRRGGYDGKGCHLIQSEEDWDFIREILENTSHSESFLYAEKAVNWVKELAVMVVRGRSRETKTYPVVETFQKEGVCHRVVAPAPVSAQVAAEAIKLALKTVELLDTYGVFGVEMFLTADNQVLLNEVAPRPHNSGHYTIEACHTSQFENHLRAILGWPLGSTDMRVRQAVMTNLLGEPLGPHGIMGIPSGVIDQALSNPYSKLHWYGKCGITLRRKMGHITQVVPYESKQDPHRKDVAVIMGSQSDWPTMKAATEMLDQFAVSYETKVVSAHRTPAMMFKFAKTAQSRGFKVIIAGAGGAAHLPGMVASLTSLPVIGVPVKSSALSGQDSLLSIVQMPRGVPVATVGIGNGTNAALLAMKILAVTDLDLNQRLQVHTDQVRQDVESQVLPRE